MSSIICLASLAAAVDFSVEEELKPISSAGIKAIKEYESSSGEQFTCTLIGKFVDLSGTGNSTDLIVTTENACKWATSAGPVWVLKNKGNKYNVVLNFVTVDVELLKAKSNGLRNIKTSRGTAGYAEVEFWGYTGKRYKETVSYFFSADDETACKAHLDICPFKF